MTNAEQTAREVLAYARKIPGESINAEAARLADANDTNADVLAAGLLAATIALGEQMAKATAALEALHRAYDRGRR